MTVGMIVSQLAGGMLVSIQIFVVTLIFSLPLGMVVAFGRMSRNPVIRGGVTASISVMLGTEWATDTGCGRPSSVSL